MRAQEVAEKDRLYRGLDRVLEHKRAWFVHLRQRCSVPGFQAQCDGLLQDPTSTYLEGEAEEIPKVKRGSRPDEGLDLLEKIEGLYGKARRVWGFGNLFDQALHGLVIVDRLANTLLPRLGDTKLAQSAGLTLNTNLPFHRSRIKTAVESNALVG